MPNRTKYSILSACIILLLMQACEYYLGINQQPKFTDENTIEGLNIFGVLRPDSAGNFNKSFVFVQKIWPVLEMDSFKIIPDASVRIEHIKSDTVYETFLFPLVPSDINFNDTLYRPLDHFVPQPRERYRMICEYKDLPDAVGETTFPPPPAIVPNTIRINGREVSFSVAPDTLIEMLDIYLVAEGFGILLSRIITDDASAADIELVLPVDPVNASLKIFGYDPSLAIYNGNANTSLNFNKYRTAISTLESGFGVFGSLNYTVIDLTDK